MTRVVWIALIIACGGKSTPHQDSPAMGSGHEGSAMHEGHEHEMEMHMSPELTKFHDVLAPRWHAAKGEKRMKDTCGAIADFKANATAVATAQPGQPTTDLVDAVSALEATCTSNDLTVFELAFGKVHERFHALMGEPAGSGAH